MNIAEVSKKYHISADTLRYYERIGLLPPVPRLTNGIRDYQEDDCNWIEFIKCMRLAGLPIEVLIEYVNLFQQGDETIQARHDLLVEEKLNLERKMAELTETHQRLCNKIKYYEEYSVLCENKLK